MTERTPDPADGDSLHAWIDESIHAPAEQVPNGMYLLAAAVADPAACDSMRTELRTLVPRGKTRLHWRDESTPLRRKIASAIGTFECTNTVVVGAQIDPRKQERARAKCMQRLLLELEQLGVSHAWIESRSPELNARDRALAARLRNHGPLNTVFVDFQQPSTEPMLWVPDAVAGTVGMARKRIGLDIRTSLGDTVREIDIEIDP